VKISRMDGVDFSLFLVFQMLKTGQPERLTLFLFRFLTGMKL